MRYGFLSGFYEPKISIPKYYANFITSVRQSNLSILFSLSTRCTQRSSEILTFSKLIVQVSTYGALMKSIMR